MTTAPAHPRLPAPSAAVGGLVRPPRTRGVRPLAVQVVVAAGAAGVLAPWWADTPTVAGLGDWLTNGGRVLGLLAGYAVLVLVVLMARVPALEAGVGADRLARWHATAGRYTVGLVVAHAVLVTWGYALTTQTGVLHQATLFLTTYPHLLAATVAAGMLLATGLVSARAARRRLPYEVWHLLHLATYAAVYLAFAHQLATGAELLGHPRTRLAWQAAYVAVAALVVWCRVWTPWRQSLRHALRVVAVVPEGPDAVSVHLGGRDLHELRAHAGQFLRWRFLARGLWWGSHPYSLSAPPTPEGLRITVATTGGHSRELARLRPGTRVLATGPYGAFTAHRRTRRQVTLVAGGLGITPLRALFETLPARAGDLTLVYRVRDVATAVFREELEEIARLRGARLVYVEGRRSALRHDPLSTDSLLRAVPGLRDQDVYVCGSPGLSAHVIAQLRRAGVPRRRIHHESFEL
ncbi:MAG: ferredoxin reductase family protein [Nocardioides sp.]